MPPLTIGFLLALLVVAAWHDIRSRRIPNALILPGVVAGLLSNAVLPQEMGGLGISNPWRGSDLVSYCCCHFTSCAQWVRAT